MATRSYVRKGVQWPHYHLMVINSDSTLCKSEYYLKIAQSFHPKDHVKSRIWSVFIQHNYVRFHAKNLVF